MYAYFKKLDYFSTECVYAPFAARGYARDFIKDLEVGSADAACFLGTADVAVSAPRLLSCSPAGCFCTTAACCCRACL